MNVRVHLESMCSLQVLSVTAICSCQLSIDGKYCSTIICQYFSNPLRLLLMLCLFVMWTNDQRAWTYSTIIVYFSNPSLVLLVVHVLLLLLLHSSSVRLLVLLDKFILLSLRSDTTQATLAFWCLVFSWFIFSHTFNLSVTFLRCLL